VGPTRHTLSLFFISPGAPSLPNPPTSPSSPVSPCSPLPTTAAAASRLTLRWRTQPALPCVAAADPPFLPRRPRHPRPEEQERSYQRGASSAAASRARPRGRSFSGGGLEGAAKREVQQDDAASLLHRSPIRHRIHHCSRAWAPRRPRGLLLVLRQRSVVDLQGRSAAGKEQGPPLSLPPHDVLSVAFAPCASRGDPASSSSQDAA
jgi:hypothetical protein